MPHIVIVPADSEKNVEVCDVDDDRIFDHAQRHTGVDTWDVVSFQHAGFQLLIDDLGYMRVVTPPVNERATALAIEHGRHPLGAPLVGDVIVLGLDALGETADVPTEVVLELA